MILNVRQDSETFELPLIGKTLRKFCTIALNGRDVADIFVSYELKNGVVCMALDHVHPLTPVPK